MAIKTPKDGLILLPKNEVLSGIKNASAEELKLLIYMFAEPECVLSDAARELNITLAQAESAFAFWRGAGLFQDAEPAKKAVVADTSSYRNYD